MIMDSHLINIFLKSEIRYKMLILVSFHMYCTYVYVWKFIFIYLIKFILQAHSSSLQQNIIDFFCELQKIAFLKDLKQSALL